MEIVVLLAVAVVLAVGPSALVCSSPRGSSDGARRHDPEHEDPSHR